MAVKWPARRGEIITAATGLLSASAAETITGGWTFSTATTVFSKNVDIENAALHIEGSDTSEFLEITVDSANNAVKMITSGMTSGGLRGWWFEQPVRLRAGADLFFYDGSNDGNVRFSLGSDDLSIIGANGVRDILFSGLSGRVKDNTYSLMQIRVTTTAAVAAVINDINTNSDKVAGYMLFNTDTSKPIWATGPNDNSVWVDATGSTAHTPIA